MIVKRFLWQKLWRELWFSAPSNKSQ